MHEVLVKPLGGLSLPRKSVVRLTDRPDMALDVYRGRKTTIQKHLMHFLFFFRLGIICESTHVHGKRQFIFNFIFFFIKFISLLNYFHVQFICLFLTAKFLEFEKDANGNIGMSKLRIYNIYQIQSNPDMSKSKFISNYK